MDRIANAIRRLMALAVAMVLAAVLSGCVIGSSKLLISEEEAITPLPAKFMLFDYSSEGERRERAETAFSVELAGSVYAAQIDASRASWLSALPRLKTPRIATWLPSK